MSQQPQFVKRGCRPRDHVAFAGQRYPRAWQRVDEFRADRGTKGLPTWPSWCFLPLAAAYAIVSEESGLQRLTPDLAGDVGRIGALAAWRVTQGIYRFDPAVYEAVRDTPVDRDIPCDVLYRLPEWCVYVETPGMAWSGQPLHGVWAHLEWDANTGRTELRLLTDSDLGLYPIILHLGDWSLPEALEQAQQEALRNARSAPGLKSLASEAAGVDVIASLRPVVEPILSLLLYLCSQAGEIGDGKRQPAKPAPVRTKRGWRLFPADRPTTWEVGERLGAALRRAYQAEQTGPGGPQASPRPHIRRAHWHGFRSGPAKRADGTDIPTAERRFDLRWLPPIPVNLGHVDELPATIRSVE